MSRANKPEHVKLLTSLFSPEKDLIEPVIQQLEAIGGKVDWVSPPLFFDRTRYYEKEMGWPLFRRFITFENLIDPEQLVEIKLRTYAIEQNRLAEGKRRINIDPGYISPERLILATGKNFTHRVYLSKGIYADLTLIFQKGSFKPLEWTYPDYAAPDLINIFHGIRTRYMQQLRKRS